MFIFDSVVKTRRAVSLDETENSRVTAALLDVASLHAKDHSYKLDTAEGKLAYLNLILSNPITKKELSDAYLAHGGKDFDKAIDEYLVFLTNEQNQNLAQSAGKGAGRAFARGFAQDQAKETLEVTEKNLKNLRFVKTKAA